MSVSTLSKPHVVHQSSPPNALSGVIRKDMSNRLRKWLRGRSSDHPPELPALPNPRPRPITPAPTDLVSTKESSLFFQVLPPEIRRRILIDAFGERTVHLDVRLEHPILSPSALARVPPRRRRHANAQLFHPSLRDTKRHREWTYWSCICHRTYPSWRTREPGLSLSSEEPSSDCCRRADGLPPDCCEYYDAWQDEGVRCFVGATGWLLACRRAYAEGVEVLYATNRFHLASVALLSRLPRLLLARRLKSIRELELVADLHVGSSVMWDDGRSDCAELAGFRMVLAQLPQMMPSLAFLHLSLQGELYHKLDWKSLGDRKVYEIVEAHLEDVDSVVRSLPKLVECRVALLSTCYRARKIVEKGCDISWRRGVDQQPERLWRELPVVSGSTNEDNDPSSAVKGYWIVHGKQGMAPPPLNESA